MTDPSGGTHYLLGHSAHELKRLDVQGALYRSATQRAFEDAGLTSGMRVLDLGCGTGDVSFLAAEMVGGDGLVVGIDGGVEAIAAARTRATTRAAVNVEFRVSRIETFEDSEPYDALVGRFVLMHQPDPVATLEQVSRSLRAGGVVCLLESYMDALLSGPHSYPHSPLYDQVVRWKSDVVKGAGADLHAGARLRSVFVEAGLPAPTTRMETRLEGGPDSPYFDYLAQSLKSMLPEAARQGLRSLEPPDPDDLAARLRNEVVSHEGVLVAWPIVAAWCRTGSAQHQRMRTR